MRGWPGSQRPEQRPLYPEDPKAQEVLEQFSSEPFSRQADFSGQMHSLELPLQFSVQLAVQFSSARQETAPLESGQEIEKEFSTNAAPATSRSSATIRDLFIIYPLLGF